MKASFSSAAGLALAAMFRAIKILRPDRPIHPSGVALTGTIDRQAGSSGIQWIDSPGKDHVTARFSRTLGTPSGWPDMLGLALRITTEAGPADVLLASTPLAWPGRFLLSARRNAGGAFTSVMPYKGARGPVLLAARPDGAGRALPAAPDAFRKALDTGTWTLGLYYARPAGHWTRFGTLALTLVPGAADTATRFDPVLHPLPGAEAYKWVSRLRQPSYATAREGRNKD